MTPKKADEAEEGQSTKKVAAYKQIIERIFAERHKPGQHKVDFKREAIESTATALGLKVPANLGDVVYTFRFRQAIPEKIAATAPKGKQWVIIGEGDALYSFVQFQDISIEPRKGQEAIKLPAATPEIVKKHTRSEEQALLAVVRYNRLVDIFLGVTAYSLQSHLRTKVPGIGQIEIDEVYVGLNREGAQFIIPVQAKGGKDKMGISQILQDHEFCKALFPSLVPRLIAAQFIADDHVAMMELVVEPRAVKIRNERHYLLTHEKAISDGDLKSYRDASGS